jgi:DNA-binding PadR family transcriptional regulator
MTTIEAVIIGLLFEKDYYGYEIEELIKVRGMREWTDIGFSSIYNILNKAEKNGLIEWRYEKQYGSPQRKVYSLTEKAKEIFPQEVAKMLSTPKRSFSEFDIGLAYSNLISEMDLADQMIQYKDGLEERLYKLKVKYEEYMANSTIDNAKSLFTRHIALLEAEIAWIKNEFGI